MSGTASYKQYNKRDRKAVLETDYSKGMMSSEGIVDDGYVKTLVNFTFEKERSTLIPRPGLTLTQCVFTEHLVADAEDFLSDEVTIKASKACVENGVTYHQTILGKLHENSDTEGDIWVGTHGDPIDSAEFDVYETTNVVKFSATASLPARHAAKFFTTGNSSIHNVPLTSDSLKRIETPVGSFAYGNSFYFFGKGANNNPGLFRTVFDSTLNAYKFEAVTPKTLSVSEAVTYGYNMLLGSNAYTFSNKLQAVTIQLEGILPYETDSTHSHSKLLMTPKKNQPIDLVCYYDAPSGKQYDIVWEWREITSSDWTEIQRTTVTFTSGVNLVVNSFTPPAENIMIRVSAYPYETVNNVTEVSDTVEKAMAVGFDFRESNYGSANTLEQKVYDLTTATGMTAWKGRLVVWGVTEDPTILFISDYNEPACFPYPNNITVFDEPIIAVKEFMDTLVVFTTDKLYQVTMASDGNSWTSTVLQAHLHINPWDKHLIQTVRNMIYFKSGNYYYMMVPRSQTLTGEMVLAPITTPITSFFDRFSVMVQDLFRTTYSYTGEYDLLTYYNYLDYEDIHNVYIYTFGDSTNVVNVDLIYNTLDRTWQVWMYETANILYPYKVDATQPGLLAASSLIRVKDMDNSGALSYRRVLQIFNWNKALVAECYMPQSVQITHYTGTLYSFSSNALVLPEALTSISNGAIIVEPTLSKFENNALVLPTSDDFYAGLSEWGVLDTLNTVFEDPQSYYTFNNYQFLDTGYREDNLQAKKRYRELQLQINNLDHTNMKFGMEYILDGAPRKILYKYDSTQRIDEFNPEYGVVYVDTTPYLEAALNDIDLTNQWSIDQNLMPEISLWKVRVSISGKGSAPRFRLFSRNNKRFELLGINWISKIMHMR